MTSGPSTREKSAVAEPPAGRVVDALHLGDRLRVLPHFDRQRDEVAAAAGIVRVGDLDRRRLQVAPALVAALGVAGFEREDHPLGQRHPGALAGLERRGHGLQHFGADHDVGLRGVGLPLTAAGPRVVLLAGVRGRPPFHVDDPDLPRLALLVAGEQLRERVLRLDAFGQQVEPARPELDHRRRLRADRADAGAHVRHRAADERHARRHRRARLAGRRIDRAQRERGVLRQPLVVERDAVSGALLRAKADEETTKWRKRQGISEDAWP